jgi:hypothetical protein
VDFVKENIGFEYKKLSKPVNLSTIAKPLIKSGDFLAVYRFAGMN